MGKHSRKIHVNRRLLTLLDLPLESSGNVPKLTMTGDFQLLIENHFGVYAYSDCFVSVVVPDKILTVKGSNLEIVGIMEDSILIRGTIDSVEYEK